MSLLDTSDPRPVHFVGIAGAGMSGLAELLVRRGVRVQGTDAAAAGAGDLVALGVEVRAPDAGFVDGARALVYSSAVSATHPELLRARALGLPVIRRAEALGEAVRGATLVAIAGTHGKTTTTVMTTEALAAAGLDPVGIAGGRVGAWGGNLRAGQGSCIVVEADEYDRSFLALAPTVAVVLNVEADHLDIYRDLDDITRTFTQFVQPARSVVLCRDDAGASALPQDATRELVRYAVQTADPASAAAVADARLVAREVVLDATGARARVCFDGGDQGELVLQVPGLHNVRNALAALGAGLMVGARVADMLPGLARFTGVERRFQVLGTVRERLVVDDYAHHPTEVAATIAAARAAHPDRRLVVAFQPHLYSRTRDFADAFGAALAGADLCALCAIYPAREQPIAGVSAALIAEAMQRAGRAPAWTGERSDCAAALDALVRDGDLVLTMGAGDITQVGPQLLARWRAS
jgi:UDP-N-acetylmuramate--alanine ligase